MVDDIIKEAREAIDMSYNYDRDNRAQAIEDLRFTAGFQWSDAAKAERKGRPMITINRSGQFLRQVSNPIRQNMPTLRVEPDSDEQKEMATIINGLLRRIQYNSSAGHVYAQAVEHMVSCGIGWFRITTDYLDDDTFDQEILIRRVFDPLSVYPDPAATEPDRADMGWCLVSSLLPRETFKKRYPDAGQVSIDAPSDVGGGSAQVAWGNDDHVRVAEFWRKTETTKTLALLRDGQMVELTSMGKRQVAQLKEQGLIVNTREAKDHKVTMHLVSGNDVLEDAYESPCRWIPLIPVIGAEIPLDHGVYRHGLIRFQREPQQLHNYFLSVAAETLGQQPRAPWIATAAQIGPYKSLWDNANRDATPYLIYDNDPDAPGPPQKVPPAPLPSGLVQMAQMMADDMKSTTGIYDAALGRQSNETSGVAITARTQQGEQATFHFVDNLEHSLEHTGRILLDMIPKVYDNERTLKIRNEDDTEKSVTINQTLMEYEGQPIKSNDLSETAFKTIRVVLGPSYASKQQEAVQNLLQLIQAVPAVGEIGGDIIARNLNFDGAEQLAERLKAILPPQVLQLENPEAAEPPPPDPMQEMQAQGAMQAMQSEVQAGEAKAQAESAKAAAEAERANREPILTEQETLRTEGLRLDNLLKVKKLREPSRDEQQQNQEWT